MPNNWLEGRTDRNDEVGSTTRASVEIADELLMYAIPQRRIVGIAEVQSHPIRGARTGEGALATAKQDPVANRDCGLRPLSDPRRH